ncbi:MAG: DUF5518 domain-containing protein [Candidatus Curtissbacteria bacterium]|nr:DUF5518 domain-containing protein [Candidatus Curtissbacteria bacterium]
MSYIYRNNLKIGTVILNFNLTRRNLLAIFLGFLVFLVLFIVAKVLVLFTFHQAVLNFPLGDIEGSLSRQPFAAILWISRTLSLMAPLLGGVVIGYMVRERGWFYGGLLGVLLAIIFMGIISLGFFVPESFNPNSFGEIILEVIFYLPLYVVLTALGGWLGEILKNRKSLV